MKWAETGIILRARLFQRDIVAHNADDVRLLLDRVREIARVGHGWRVVRRNCEAENRLGEYSRSKGLRKNCGYQGIVVNAFGNPLTPDQIFVVTLFSRNRISNISFLGQEH